jgi:hypothetical protein
MDGGQLQQLAAPPSPPPPTVITSLGRAGRSGIHLVLNGCTGFSAEESLH